MCNFFKIKLKKNDDLQTECNLSNLTGYLFTTLFVKLFVTGSCLDKSMEKWVPLWYLESLYFDHCFYIPAACFRYIIMKTLTFSENLYRLSYTKHLIQQHSHFKVNKNEFQIKGSKFKNYQLFIPTTKSDQNIWRFFDKNKLLFHNIY